MRSKWIEDNLNITLRSHQKDVVDTSGDLGLRWGRRTGKTLTLALIAIHDAAEGREVAVGASPSAVLGIIRDGIMELLDGSNLYTPTITRSYIYFDGGGGISFFPLGQDVRAKPVDTMLLDEADYRDGWMDALFPVASDIIAASTPASRTDHGDFRRWCDNEIVTEIVMPTTHSPHWTAAREKEFKTLYSPELYRVEILAEWPEPPGVKDLPKKIQLYWKCECCEEEHLYPQERARKYCDDACKQAAYRMRKNTKVVAT